jgi:hypothetical protein
MQKYINYIKQGMLTAALMISAALFVSCDEDNIVIGKNNDDKYIVDNSYAYLRHAGMARNTTDITITTAPIVKEIYFGLTKAIPDNASLTVKIDETLMDAYNKQHYTTYQMYPANLVTLANGGVISSTAYVTESATLNITISPNSSLETGTYLLPLTVSASEKVNPLNESKELYYLITVNPVFPGTEKTTVDGGPRIVSICYVGTGSNPLNILSYTLKNSGKQFFDICNIFSASMNYDDNQKRVILAFNENLKVILGNRDTYIKPLQERGIKVSLGILPNHMGVGMANLTPAVIVDFAQQLKDVVDTYDLDGLDFDDEWAEYEKAPSPLAPNSSGTNNYANLIAEVRRLLPDKLITVYSIGAMSQLRNNATIGGINVDASTMIDYSYNPYYGGFSALSTTNLRAFTRPQWGPYPLSFDAKDASSFIDASNNKSTYSAVNMTRVRTDGYGVNLMYNLGNVDYTALLTPISQTLWGEDTEHTGPFYDNVAKE